MTDEVLEHFSRFFGGPGTCLSVASRCSVIMWDAQGHDDCKVLTTLGMSSEPQVIPASATCPSRHPRTELVMWCRTEQTETASRLLADLARYPFENQTFVHWWHTVPLGVPLASTSPLVAVLLTFPPLDEAGFATLWVGGKRIDFVWVVPITAEELAIAQQSGIETLEEHLEATVVDIGDLQRRPVPMDA